ncbi:MAG TPA: CARDB domain-containing protein, partial [Thermoplasmata archaeon]|nr:CARDB domain-containing protein [Thermoplasmata archaeon]
MQNRAGRDARAFSLSVVGALVFGGFFAAILAMSPPSQAGTCDQVGGVITGDWTITNAQVCSGILYTVDGTININSGGSLTLIDGGLSFAKDASHTGYSLNVNAGGALVLDNSTVTTQTDAISPYLKLAFTVAGANSQFTMKHGASLKFPGWFNATSASLNITDSKVTGFTDSEISDLGLDTDDNNDAPLIAWSATSASVYRSTIERIYEYTSGNSSNIDLSATSSLYAYDSYVGVDYASNGLTPGRHNELRVDGSSNAYLYNVTIDRTQDPASRVDWESAFRPTAAGGSVNLLRWAHDTVVDSSGIPIAGATIWSTLSPSSTTAQYPDNGLTATPTSRTLWYLGRQASGANAWNRTNPDGVATIPLYTDQITTATLPNAESFGNYHQVATYSGSTSAGDVSFNPYPAVSDADNNQALTISFANLQVCPTGVTTWSFDRQIVGDVSVATCLEVSGHVRISTGGLYVDQGSDGKSRAYVKILSGGSLTLVDSTVWSNFPLPFYVANGGALVTSAGSALNLSARGLPGLLREDGATSSVSITDSTVDGNVTLYGGGATLVRVTLTGPGVSIDTVQRTNLWDASLSGVTSLAISTDDGDVNTVDVDVRNTTFDSLQTSQLVFGGSQNVQLTSVQTYDPDGTWWETMITGGSRVARYWWLTVDAVDGTGTLLADANVGITVQRMDPNTLINFTVPNPSPGDIYYTPSTTWPVSAPLGFIVYRAFSESRTVSTRSVNDSYLAQGSAVIEGTTYTPDAPGSSLVMSDTVLGLTFSSLTPDLSVASMSVSGGNGASQLQPINTDISVTVTVRNVGQINVRNVTVSFFEDNVDRNLDGIMDFAPLDYRATGLWIDDLVIPLVPKNGTATASIVWHPLGALESSRTVSAVVDPPVFAVTDGGLVRETDEANNILARTFTLFTWPDLAISSADVQFTTDPVVNNDVAVRVTVHNVGTNRATGATLEIWEGALRVGGPATFDITPGVDTVVTVTWRPASVGAHILTFATKLPSGPDIRNKDYVLGNNNATFSVGVQTPPDLVLRQSDYGTIQNVTQNHGFTITVIVYNVGQTTAVNVSVAAFLAGFEIGRVNGLTIGASLTTPLNVSGISATGQQAIQLRVDPDNRINEGGVANESNNAATVTVNVQPPLGDVILISPATGQTLEPGADFAVTGYVRDQNGNGISSVDLTIALRSGAGTVALNTTTSQVDGFFIGRLTLPAGQADGSYDLVITPSSGLIQPYTQAVTVKTNLPFLSQPVPILGLPYWLFFIILAAAAAVIIGATVYWKVYGLGKMVECGECGAFIPEDATSCPKCGVEFEKDMAKCSNCQA